MTSVMYTEFGMERSLVFFFCYLFLYKFMCRTCCHDNKILLWKLTFCSNKWPPSAMLRLVPFFYSVSSISSGGYGWNNVCMWIRMYVCCALSIIRRNFEWFSSKKNRFWSPFFFFFLDMFQFHFSKPSHYMHHTYYAQ